MEQKNDYHHIPVLLHEVIHYLNPKPGENFVDGTLGGGGYTKELLKHIQPGGKVLAIDLDTDAIENVKGQMSGVKGFEPVYGNFSHIDKIIIDHNFPAPDGIVADIGLSSYQLDQSGRGISFQNNEVLDMRFDQHGNTVDARFIINTYEFERLHKIFNDYGEDKFSRQIAQKIIKVRQETEIKYTSELFKVIEESLPKPVRHKAADSARRIFQALRIAVNHELENLQAFLPQAFNILKPGGRLVIVSFHSLEDRIVKQFFLGLAKGCVCPPDFPLCRCGRNPQGKILTKKPVTAEDKELEKNSRSKPAKLRALIKL